MKLENLPVHESQPFDEWDDDLMNDICGPTLAKPIQNLLITLSQSNVMTDRKVAEAVLPELKLLRAACVERWRNL